MIAISFEPRAYISFPPSGFSLKWYQSIFQNRQLTDSIWVSLTISVYVALVVMQALLTPLLAIAGVIDTLLGLRKRAALPPPPTRS